MADLSRSVVLNITGRNDDAKAKLDEISAKIDALQAKGAQIKIGADDSRFNATVAADKAKLDILGRDSANPKIGVDDRQLIAHSATATATLRTLDRQTANPKLGADDKGFNADYASLIAKMDKFRRSEADAKLGEKGGPEVKAEIDDLEVKLKEFAKIDAKAGVGLDGFTKTKAEIDDLKASLDELQRKADAMKASSGASSLIRSLDSGGLLSKLGGRFGIGGGAGGTTTLSSVLRSLIGVGGAGGGEAGGAGASGASGIASSPLGLAALIGGGANLAALVPGLVGGGIGIAGGLGLLGGQLLANAGSANILAQDHAAVAAAQNAQQRAQAQAVLHGDATTSRNLATESSSLAQLGDTIGAAFTPSALQVNKILINMEPIVNKLAGMLKGMFQAALPFLNQFMQFMGHAGEILIPAFTKAMEAMRPAFPIITQGFLAIVKGIAGFIEALGPGMQASAILFKGLGIAIEVILKGIGYLFSWLAIAVQEDYHIWDIILKLMIKGFVYMGEQVGKAAVIMWHGIIDAVHAIEVGFRDFVSGMQVIGRAIVFAWDAMVNGIESLSKGLWNIVSAVFKAGINGISTAATVFWHFMVKAWEAIASGVEAAWSAMWNLLKTIGSAAINFIASLATAFWHTLVKIWDAIASGLQSAWQTMWNLLKSVATTMINFITGIATTFWHTLVNIWNSISNSLSNAWTTLWNLLRNISNAGINFITSVATAFWHTLVNIWNAISNTVSTVWNNMWNDIRNLANAGINGIENIASAFWHWIVNTWNTISSDVTGIFSRMWSDLQGAARAAVGILGNIINGIENVFEVPVKFVVDRIWDPFAGLFNKVTSAVGVNIKLPTLTLAEGGPVPGPKGAGDVMPALLTPGEHVLTTSQVARAGGHDAIMSMFGGSPGSSDNLHFAGGGSPFTGPVANSTPSNVSKTAQQDISGVQNPNNIPTTTILGGLEGLAKDATGFLTKMAGWAVSKIESTLFGPLLNAIPDTGIGWKIVKAVIQKIIDAISGKISNQVQAANAGGPGSGPAGQGVSGGEMANGRQIYQYLLANVFGGAKVAAAGATASIWGESTWNPFAQGTGGRGLIGWTPPGTISNAAFSGGMATQLPAIIQFISRSGDWGVIAAMKGATSVDVAAEQWGRGVERYGIDDVHSEGVALASSFMYNGGIINEPIIGTGLRSGMSYSFGEQGPEWVTPFGRGPNYGTGGGGDIYNIYPPDSASNPDAYALTLIQAIRDYKRHHGGQATNIG